MNQINAVFIDDDFRALDSIKLSLEMEGFGGIRYFTSWYDALPSIMESTPNVLVCDMVMPDISGNEVIKEFKRICPQVPVYMLSGFNDVPSAMECIKSGASDYLIKPLDIATFIEEVFAPIIAMCNRCELSSIERITELQNWYEEELDELFKESELSQQLKKALIDEKLALSPKITLPYLAQHIGSNITYISRFFRNSVQCTFPQWLNCYRIASFVVSVINDEFNSQLTIEALGNNLGYRSRSSFSNACKKCCGLTPQRVLKELQMKK